MPPLKLRQAAQEGPLEGLQCRVKRAYIVNTDYVRQSSFAPLMLPARVLDANNHCFRI